MDNLLGKEINLYLKKIQIKKIKVKEKIEVLL